jgi:DNA anti-recombination protein RmuC
MLPVLTIILSLISLALLILVLIKVFKPDNSVLLSRLDAFEKAHERTEDTIRKELSLSREELRKTAREQRQELIEVFETFARASFERLDFVRTESASGAKQLREEVVTTLMGLSETIRQTIGELAAVQKDQLETMSGAVLKLSDKTTSNLKNSGARWRPDSRTYRWTTQGSLNRCARQWMKNFRELWRNV